MSEVHESSFPEPRACAGPRTRGRGYLWPAVVAGLLMLFTAALFLGHARARAGTWLSAPLDDTFIHFQYAKQLARGHLLQYNDGDSRTTGATSLLYMFALAPGWLMGLRGLHLLIWAWIFNGLCHLGAGLAVFSIIKRSTCSRALAYSGMTAFLLNGPLLWGTYSHMEIALFSLLLLLTLNGALGFAEAMAPDRAAPPIPRRLLVLGALLAAVRPEGLLLSGGLSLWLLWQTMPSPVAPSTSAGTIHRLLRALHDGAIHALARRRALLPFASALAVLGVFLALTGRIATNASTKSHLADLVHEPARYLQRVAEWLPQTFTILLGTWPTATYAVMLVLVLGGLAGWASPGLLGRQRPGAGALLVGWLALLTLFYAVLMARRDHNDRYYLPYVGLTVVAAWWLLGALARALASRNLAADFKRAPLLFSLMLIVFQAPQLSQWAQRYGDNCRDLVHQHIKVVEWLRKNTTPQTRIAVNDAGLIPYLSERYSYDIVGLAHNAFYQRKGEMQASNAAVFEALAALPARPELMVAYPEWIPDLYLLPIFDRLTAFSLSQRSIVANDTKVVWRLHWDRLAPADAVPLPLQAGERLRDQLNVANLESEAAHHYRLQDHGWPEGSVGMAAVGTQYLIEGGRTVSTGESFRVHNLLPHKPLRVIMRALGPGTLDLLCLAGAGAAVSVRTTLSSGLAYAVLTVNTLDSSTLALTITTRNRPYTVYRYWFVQ